MVEYKGGDILYQYLGEFGGFAVNLDSMAVNGEGRGANLLSFFVSLDRLDALNISGVILANIDRLGVNDLYHRHERATVVLGLGTKARLGLARVRQALKSGSVEGVIILRCLVKGDAIRGRLLVLSRRVFLSRGSLGRVLGPRRRWGILGHLCRRARRRDGWVDLTRHGGVDQWAVRFLATRLIRSFDSVRSVRVVCFTPYPVEVVILQ